MDRSMGLFRLRLRKNNCVVQTDEGKEGNFKCKHHQFSVSCLQRREVFLARHRIVLYATLNTETKWVMMKENV